MTAPPIACGVLPWPIAAECLPQVPGVSVAGLYPGFTPGPTAFPGEGAITDDGTAVDPFALDPDRPFALGAANPGADPIAVARLRESIRAAVATLSALLGHMYVVRCATIRPCVSTPTSFRSAIGRTFAANGGWWIAYQDSAGAWHNYDPCSAGRCDPLGRGAVELPQRWGPVRAVRRVEVDGAVIDPSGYTLEHVAGRDVLYRTGADGCGGGAWPTQDLGLPLGCPGTWAVTIEAGTPPPPGTALMVATLAREMFALCVDGSDCRIPRGWVSVSRDGVSVERIDAAAMIANRLTGLPEVDSWVSAHNPTRRAFPVTVGGPGTLRGVL